METNQFNDEETKKIKDELDIVLKKYDAEFATNISFPQFRILPDEVQLALKVLQKNEMIMSTVVIKRSKNKPKKAKK